MTPEGLYTLSPEMEAACEDVFDEISGDVEIIFCNDRDYILKETLTRVVYYMSLAMAKRFDNCTVDSVNVTNAKPDAIVLHTLPVPTDGNLSEDLINSPQFVGVEEALNLPGIEMAALTLLVGKQKNY